MQAQPPATPSPSVITNPTSAIGNISGTVKLLQEFGNTRVLSSPKLMALNNQTALLKVVDNLVYFDIQAQTTTSATGPSLTTFTTTAQERCRRHRDGRDAADQ